MSTLIPRIDDYLENSLNVLLIGLHGTGKTVSVLDAAERLGWKIKLFTCSTLDVYTDLVGVPLPRTDASGVEHLKMIRPREVDDADFIFFDEINRADAKTLNAILEIVQFRSINGERLPNLKCCWAAMNPPGMDYQVDDLDPALVDRFDIYEDVAPKPSVSYMVNQGIKPHVAKVFVNWWSEQNRAKRGSEGYISPRKLMAMANVYQKLGDFRPALPTWITCDKGKLKDMLAESEAKAKGETRTKTSGNLGNGPSDTIQYNKPYVKNYAASVAALLTNNQDDLDTHNAVLATIESCHAPVLVRDYPAVLNALKPTVLEAYLADLQGPKFQRLDSEVKAAPEAWQQRFPLLKAAVEAEGVRRS